MFVIFFLLGAFNNTFSATIENNQNLPWEIQKFIENRAIKYNEHCKHNYIVDLRESNGLWNNLVSRGICKKKSKRSLVWLEKKIKEFKDETDFLDYALVEYDKNIKLYKLFKKNENIEAGEEFNIWLDTRGHRSIEEVMFGIKELQSMKASAVGMMKSLKKLFEKKSITFQLDCTETVDFILNKNLRKKLGKLSYQNEKYAYNAVYEHTKNMFFPDLLAE